MSRKNKTLRAFLHQNQNPTIKQAWDTAWKRAQKIFHTRSMQDMEKQVAELQAELARELQRRFDGNEQASREHREDVSALVDALERVMYCNEVGFLPEDVQQAVSDALAARRKEGQ